uniref:Type VI secretion system tip protein VgrG n=1 Tax=Steinernema glaseri TaxID=37863 RepID=A0A1I8ARN2_9BILA
MATIRLTIKGGTIPDGNEYAIEAKEFLVYTAFGFQYRYSSLYPLEAMQILTRSIYKWRLGPIPGPKNQVGDGTDKRPYSSGYRVRFNFSLEKAMLIIAL